MFLQRKIFMECLEQTFYWIDDLTTTRIILEDINTEFGVKAPADFVSNRNKILNESITVVYSPLIKTEKERVSIQDAIENVLMTSENISKANKKSIKNCSRHQEQYKVIEQIKR